MTTGNNASDVVTPPLPSLEQIEHVLQTLFTSQDSNMQNEANRWLLELQNHPQIIAVTLELIKSERPFFSQFYGIQTIYTKINQDWESRWSEELRAQIRSTIFTRFLSDVDTNQLFRTKLSNSIAAMMAHSIPRLWEHPINDMLAVIGSDQSSDRLKKSAVDVLTQLPNEYETIVISKSRSLLIKNYFVTKSDTLVSFLVHSLDASKDSKTSLQLMKCLQSWLYYSSSKLLESNNILPTLFKTLDSEELAIEGFNVINDLINFTTYRSPLSNKEPANSSNIHSDDKVNFDRLIAPIVQKLVSMKPIYNQSVKDNPLLCRSFAEILSQIVECYTPIIATLEIQESQQVLSFLLEVCTHKDKEMSEISFDAWAYLSHQISDMADDSPEREKFKQIYAHLLTIILQKSSYPINIEKVDYSSEMANDIITYRENVSDIIMSCFETITLDVFLSYIENLLKNQCNNWQSYEVVIFIFKCVYEEIMDEDIGAVSIISHVLTLPIHPTLSNTILSMTELYGDYIYEKGELLASTFNYIVSLIQHNDMRTSAFKTLSHYCEKYGDRLYKYTEGSLLSLEKFYNAFNPSEQKNYIKSILLLSSYVEPEKIPNILQRTLSPVILDLKNTLALDTPSGQKSILIVDRLSVLKASLDIPEEYFEIFKDFVQNIWSLLEESHSISIKYVDQQISETLWQVIWKIVLEMDSSFNLEKVYNFIQLDLNVFHSIPYSCYETLNQLLKKHLTDPNYQPTFIHLLNQLSVKSLPLISANNNDSIPIITRYYKTMALVIESLPQAFYSLQNVITIIELSIVSILNIEKDSVMSILEFINQLFIKNNPVETLTVKYSPSILSNVLYAIAKDGTKQLTTYFAKLLHDWIDKYSGDITQNAIKEALIKSNWLPNGIPEAERERLAKLILSVKNLNRFKALINDFTEVCNNFMTWDVFVSYEQ